MDPVFFKVEDAYNQPLFPVRVTRMDPKLFEAATSGNIKALEFLIRGGIDILRQMTPMKNTSIHIAARHGHSEIITFVHDRCPELLTKANSIGDTPLHIAARSGHLHTVSCLIDCANKATDTEAGRKEELLEFIRNVNQEKNTVLHEAIKYDHLEIVNFLMEKDPELLCMDNYLSESPLHMAVEKGKSQIVEAILRKECYSYNGPNGRTALHAAVLGTKPATVMLLLKKKPELINKEDDNMRTALHFASTLGQLDLVRILLNCSTSSGYILDKSGSAPMHLSARFVRPDIIREFLHRCPDLKDLFDGKCRNLLHIAIESKQAKVVRYILGEKMLEEIINGKDMGGNTPLHQAASMSLPYMANLLVRDKRVDTTILNRKQLTALDIARSRSCESVKGHKELVLATLLRFTISPHPKSVFKETIFCGLKQRRKPIEWYKDKANTLLVVATLVTTVAFAAGFTVPGGYRSEGAREGMPILMEHAKFEEFIWWDSLAMYFSMVAVVLLVWVQFLRKVPPTFLLLHIAQILSILALQCMSLAFISGLTLTLVQNESLKRKISMLGYAFYIISFAKFLEYFRTVMYICPCYVYFRSWVIHLSAHTFRSSDADGIDTNEKNTLSLLLHHYK